MIDSAVMTVIVPLGRKFSAARNSPMLRRSSLAGGVVGPSFGGFGAGAALGFGADAAGFGAGVDEPGAGFGAGVEEADAGFAGAKKLGAGERGGEAADAAGSAGRAAVKDSAAADLSAGLSAGLAAPLSAGLAGRGSCRLSVGLVSTSASAPFLASPSFGVDEAGLAAALMAAAMLGLSDLGASAPAAWGSFRSSASSIADRAAAAASWILPVIAISLTPSGLSIKCRAAPRRPRPDNKN